MVPPLPTHLPTQSGFTLVQRLDTTGARAVEPFELDGEQYLAVAQLSKDIEGQTPHLNAGDSGTTLPIYRWHNGRFEEHQQLDVPGGEDADFFRIGERSFLATASLRTGSGPYVLDAQSVVYEWTGHRFESFQTFPTFAAKQWRHFSIDGRHFLALAQGVVMDGIQAKHPAKSCIFEWKGERFEPFQVIASAWGYNWKYFQIGGLHLLAYADHLAPSRLLQWTGHSFEDFQTFDGKSGRAFCFFESQGQAWLAFANLLHDSVLYRWADGRFEIHQPLCGPGARELAWLPDGHGGQLVQANFILGSREAPQPMLNSCTYRWNDGLLKQADTFESSGAVDVASFQRGDARYIAVANSVSAAMRFRTDTLIYQIEGHTP